MPSSSSRLRLRFALLGLFTIVPALGVILYDQTVERTSARRRAVEETLRLTRVAANQQASVFFSTRRMLLTVTQVPALRGEDSAACASVLGDVLRDHPTLINIWVSRTDGRPFCSATPLPPNVSNLNRSWFVRAMQAKTTVVGDYQLSVTNNQPDVVVATPIVDAAGDVERVVGAAIPLEQLGNLFAGASLPTAVTVSLLDRDRTILARHPDPGPWIGRKESPLTNAVSETTAPDGARMSDASGVDGVRRLYVSAPVRAVIDTGLTVTIGVDASAVFAEANRMLIRHLWWIGLVAVAAVGLAIAGGDMFVARPLGRLRAVAERIATGDLRARAQIGRGAFSDLGAAIDTMTSALDARQHERDQAESNRLQLAAIVEDADDAILSATLEGVIVSWNAGAERLFGWSSAEAIGRPLSMITPDDRQPERARLLDRMRTGERIARFDTVRRRKDGSLVPVALTLAPRRTMTGEVVGASAIIRDLTAQLHAEETLRVSEERFRRITDTIAEVFWMADTALQTTIYVSPAYERVWGRPLASLYAHPRSFLEAVHPDDRERVERTVQSQRDGLPFEHEYRIIRPDGDVRWIRDRGFPVPNPSGPVQTYVGAAEDVTERLHAERRLQDAEARMRFALDASRVGVWEANLPTGEMYWSETCEEMHGLVRGTFDGTFEGFLALVHPEDEVTVRHAIDRAIAEHREAELEYRVTWRDHSQRWINSTGHFFYDEQGVAARGAGVTRDVTERRSLEDQLRQAQKMDAVGRLAGGIAHDFNNMLTAIIGNADIVLSGLHDGDPHRRDIQEIVRAAERAADLTQQLLAFSRKQILTPHVVHLGDVVSGMTPMLRRLLGETVDLRTTMSDKSYVKADAAQMEQVIMNLAVNARDAMISGGRLTIETADVVLDTAYVRQHPTVRPGAQVMVAVTDTGHGMDLETQKRIFEPFFTTKPVGSGTGLGLATAYGIVQQSGGHISVYSEVGQGTTFKVYLPQTEETESLGTLEPVGVTRVVEGTETVLLVEDEDLVREFAHKALSRYGYTVHAMPDPMRAIRFADAHHGPIHVILSDVVLPGMNGPSMAKTICRVHGESKVLYISGYPGGAVVHQNVLDPDMFFLQKPFTAEALVAKLRDVLDVPAIPSGSERT